MTYCLSPQVIAESLAYDPASGALTWKERPQSHFKRPQDWKTFNTRFSGTVATADNGGGYLRCSISYRGQRFSLYAHRIASCLQTGRWPDGQIDHADGNRSNNAWVNLREATQTENLRNTFIRRHNSTGYKWAQRSSDGKRFVARATVNGRSVHFGTFDTAYEASAHAASKLAALHGKFLNIGVR